MKCNVGKVDKTVRFVLGIVAIALVFFVQSTVLKWIFAIVGVIMLFTALTGFCLLYLPFGISTCEKKEVKDA